MTIPEYDKECDCAFCKSLRNERNEESSKKHKERKDTRDSISCVHMEVCRFPTCVEGCEYYLPQEQTVEELQELLERFGMKLSVEWINPAKNIPSAYKNPFADQVDFIDIGERGANVGAAFVYALALKEMQEKEGK
jgi:hypothetical protein